MKAMICERCGGQINPETMRCEYCGTYYKKEYGLFDHPIITLVEHPDIKVIQGKICFDNHMVSRVEQEYLHKCAKHDMTLKLAEALEPEVEYKVFEDYQYDQQIVIGRVRIVSPKYRF